MKKTEYRKLVEAVIGRKLLSCEIVHHIDGNHFNNNIDNIEGIEYKVCNKCLELKTLVKFHKHTTSHDGLSAFCKKCVGISQKHSTYYKLRWSILLRDDFRCQYCGNTPNDCKLHIDHIKPKAKGGKDTMDNLITSCEYCNLGKSDVLLKQHNLEKIKRLSNET